MLVIGLNGFIDAGKSSVAKILCEQHGFYRIKFAGPLKAMLRAFYQACKVDEETIERKIEGDLKNVPCQHLCGRTPRHAMQTLGTEWGRDLIAPQLWVSAASTAIQHAGTIGHQRIVLDDCRFLNEVETLRLYGGAVWRVVRPGLDAASHTSESGQLAIQPDRTIVNNGTLDDLANEVEEVMGETFRQKAA